MSGLEHQDWEKYIIHCKGSISKTNNKDQTTLIKKYIPNPDKKLHEKIEKGELKHKKVDQELSKDFQKWRQSKNKTQKDVAQLLNVQPQIINKFESGQLKNDPKLVSKIKRLIKNKI